MSPLADQPNRRFRILTLDGGGIRGLISVLVVAELERRLQEHSSDPEVRITDFFHLLAGTSAGGLNALALTAPSAPPLQEIADFYTEDGPKIFHRSFWRWLLTLDGIAGPKYSSAPVAAAIRERIGAGTLAEATRDLLITSFDMRACSPYFFKRWQARESAECDFPLVDVGLSTSAAPTYFGSHGIPGGAGESERALVDGGVFANNPVIAAIAEALGRGSDPPARLEPADLFVVSIGTGDFETRFSQSQVGGWGALRWVSAGGEVPIVAAMMEGSAEGADYWAHMLLNHVPGEERPSRETVGRGKRFYRLQVELEKAIGLDDASPEVLEHALPAAARQLIADRNAEIDEIVAALLTAPPVDPS